MTDRMRLWDDNPTVTDLLGIDTVVQAVAAALLARDLDPVTVALQSPWGGGKSSALDMLAKRFEASERVLVVRVDPWEFEDSDDVRATLISHLLTELRSQRPASFTEKVGDLLTRIAWKRVGATIAKSALTMSADPLDIIKAFAPDPKDQPTNMAGFRDEFDKMMDAAKDVDKVVVLVDDLDRCKPASVVASLEAIKVFLAVPKMAFVLAAEEDMIRWAIAQDIHAGGRSEFADRYLEKIVQLPVSLPRLTPETTEDFVTLLLCQKQCEAADMQPDFKALVAHVAERRRNRQYPLLHDGDYPEGTHRPDAADRRMAALVARGLSGDQWSSPRAIKRFLNAWGVREAIANAREVAIKPDVSLKLYLRPQTAFDDVLLGKGTDRAPGLLALPAGLGCLAVLRRTPLVAVDQGPLARQPHLRIHLGPEVPRVPRTVRHRVPGPVRRTSRAVAPFELAKASPSCHCRYLPRAPMERPFQLTPCLGSSTRGLLGGNDVRSGPRLYLSDLQFYAQIVENWPVRGGLQAGG